MIKVLTVKEMPGGEVMLSFIIFFNFLICSVDKWIFLDFPPPSDAVPSS